MRSILSVSSDELSKLAAMADQIWELSSGPTTVQLAPVASGSAHCREPLPALDTLQKQISELSLQVAALNERIYPRMRQRNIRPRSRERSRSRRAANSNICYYLQMSPTVQLPRSKGCSRGSGKLIPRLSLATGTTGIELSRLYISDKDTATLYLVDTGANISVIPPAPHERRNCNKLELFAANGSTIKTYGRKLLNLDLGLRSFP
ncbi:uncharacterized protein LOC111615008 [Centruroides sculpturatus]|uniref:uncharacterized protein LOC111615008 n=1 Tax=Centruroides sculpturatus TaxID=218467 RepID=UPI000C6D72BA|nr:uncharacterized protein LOC111615008 [Centruroides sculpturatus]